MTLDEAIKRFSDNAEYERSHGSLQGCLEFRQLAEWLTELKELKEHTKPCEDCISRQRVLDTIDSYMTHHMGFLDLKLYVTELPSVQPEPKTGRWIGHREHCENLGVMPSGLGAYKWCSNCDCGIDVIEWHKNNYNFCPNCGAKMVEPKESEDKKK